MSPFLKMVAAWITDMLSQKDTAPGNIEKRKETEARERAFQYQLDILSKEIDMIDHEIGRLDEQGRATRNWAILTWGGAIAAILSQLPEFRPYVFVTGIIPVLFWLTDTRWTHLMRSALYRLDKISDFLASEDFLVSFQESKFVNLRLLDPRAKHHRGESRYRQQVNFLRVMVNKPELLFFYGGQILLSIILGLIFWRWN